jgi:hypothetical protein
MAHWAKIDENNIVTQVTVGDNNSPDEGYQWLIDNLGGTWIKTSFNNNIRKNYAGVGFTYDEEKDAFIPPKPFPSWTLNEVYCNWEPPVSKPIDSDRIYIWNEETGSWIEASV